MKELTGRWHLVIKWYGISVMVEHKELDFDNETILIFSKAKPFDLMRLKLMNINNVNTIE